MQKIQMPCTEEQFNRDLKPFLVDAGVDISECKFFNTYRFLQAPYKSLIKIGNWHKLLSYKTIDYNPKEFLKHLGIDIYDVGDVVKIGEYECGVKSEGLFFWLSLKRDINDKIYSQFNLHPKDLKYSITPKKGDFPEHATLYDINKTIQFLKSHEKQVFEKPIFNIKATIDAMLTLGSTLEKLKENKMQEKPFTIEQAKDMLAIESLKDLAYKHYPELKSTVNTINEELLGQLSYEMFGNQNIILIAKQSAISINRADLDGKSLIVDERIEIILHKVFTGGTLIEFKDK